MGVGRGGLGELVSFTALGNPGQNQTCVSAVLSGKPAARTGSRWRGSPHPAAAHKGLKGPIPAPPSPGPRGVTATTRSKGSAGSQGTPYCSQTLRQRRVPAPRPTAPVPPRSPGTRTGKCGAGPGPGTSGARCQPEPQLFVRSPQCKY